MESVPSPKTKEHCRKTMQLTLPGFLHIQILLSASIYFGSLRSISQRSIHIPVDTSLRQNMIQNVV